MVFLCKCFVSFFNIFFLLLLMGGGGIGSTANSWSSKVLPELKILSIAQESLGCDS